MTTSGFENTFESWRKLSRDYLKNAIPPEDVHWNPNSLSLFSQETFLPNARVPVAKSKFMVPREFLLLAEYIACANDDSKWDLLYRLLFRLQYENANLLKITVDADVHRALLLQKSVKRDIHKMHAFVRFKKSELEGEEVFIAWHRPEHLITKIAAPFFARRFGDRKWTIFTPDASAHWDLNSLSFGDGIPQHDFQSIDDWDEVWKTYYKAIFNPARIKIKAMKLEMAPKYWSSLPEASLIKDLVREAPSRLQKMVHNQNTSAKIKAHVSLDELKNLADSCTACPLYQQGTKMIFGEGPKAARMMLIGEQPGDHEDRAGLPFVGPAGEILNQALLRANLDRKEIYLTNAVKHFKHQLRGKDRIHKKASGSEMHACKPWLEAEIALVKPQVIVALGLTAATSILGRLPKISDERGQIISDLKIAKHVILSWHPAAILRSETETARLRFEQLCSDLQKASGLLFHELVTDSP